MVLDRPVSFSESETNFNGSSGSRRRLSTEAPKPHGTSYGPQAVAALTPSRYFPNLLMKFVSKFPA